ncbi:hypothetical protein F8Y87_25045, partial [Vibrio alginolyticus]|nr:hypothetical protein [Vibrio alginolyticus]
MDNKVHYLRNFEDQLYDAVYMLYFSLDIVQENYKDDVIRPHVRASIINTCLLLECGANCLIESLDLPKQFFDDIDKLPFLSKFEFYLSKVNPGQRFDRGAEVVQKVRELKTIRDGYVHPKVKKSKYEKVSLNTWDADYGNTPQLKFPRAPKKWHAKHAISALKAVNDFYNEYLLNWCALSTRQTVDLLLSSEKADLANPIGASIDCVGGLDRAATEWGIDFKFIGKN